MRYAKRIFVSGATGYLGYELVQEAVRRGFAVHVFVRDMAKAKKLYNHPAIQIFQGSFTDNESILKAMKSCTQAYLVAGIISTWLKDESQYYKIHVEGNRNLLLLAQQAGIKKAVVTSTAGVFGPSLNGKHIHEDSEQAHPYFNEYEKSKAAMADMIRQLHTPDLEICIVNPSRIYGHGKMGRGNPVNKLIDLYLKGKWHYIPGNGRKTGNYVFINDVINGHFLSMELGVDKESYILGGTENINYNELFKLLGNLSGKHRKMIHTSIKIIKSIAYIQLFLVKYFGIRPLFTPDWVSRYYFDWPLDISKARSILGYSPTPLTDGLIKTLQWLKTA